jgi:hypothetical protein
MTKLENELNDFIEKDKETIHQFLRLNSFVGMLHMLDDAVSEIDDEDITKIFEELKEIVNKKGDELLEKELEG